jgi:hypothetical protein
MILLAAMRIIAEKAPKSPIEARGVLDALSKWLAAVTGSSGTLMHALDQQMALWAESVGVLAIAVLENRRFISIIDHASTKSAYKVSVSVFVLLIYRIYENISADDCILETRKRLSDGLSSFLPVWTHLLSPQSQPQTAERLAIAFKSRSVLEEKAHQPSEMSSLEVATALQIEAIPNIPIVNARASMLIFLNSLV